MATLDEKIKLLRGNNIENGIYLSQFLKASPLAVLGLICWFMGEAAGYATGSKAKVQD